MARFRYKAASRSGEVLEGEIVAPTRMEAVRRLQARGQVPILAEEVAAAPPRRAGRLRWRSGIGAGEVGVFTVQLAELLKSGLPLGRALDVLARLPRGGAFGEVVEDLRSRVRRGLDLSAALEGHPKVFSRMYVNMARAGEASGALDVSLARAAEALERSRDLRETLTSSLIYPVVLLVFAGLSLGVILGVVIPRLSTLFAEVGRELPIATRAVVFIGEAVRDWWWLLIAMLAGLWIGARWLLRRPAIRTAWDRWLLTVPVAGPLISKYEAAKFLRALGSLLQGGVPLLEAIEIARRAAGNRAVEQGLGRVAASVRQGEGFARPLREAEVFPGLAADLLQVGEETGNLEAMMLRVAGIYEREARTGIKRAVDILGPLTILVLAAMIGGIVMSVLSAVLGINELAF